MTNKQKKALRIVEWFIPSKIDWAKATDSYHMVGLDSVSESANGVTPEEAFFLRSERGKLPDTVTNKARLAALLWGQRRMALQVAQWKEGRSEMIIFPSDFDEEPEEIKELFMSKVWNQL